MNNKNIHTTPKGSIGYAGTIKIELLRENKVKKTILTHNAGTKILFSFLANCLVGNYASENAPKFIMLGDDTSTQISATSIPYSSRGVSVESDSASTTLKFLIPFSNLSVNTEIWEIRLYTSNNEDWDNYCAIFNLDEETKIVSDGKSNILITWTMTIKNQE